MENLYLVHKTDRMLSNASFSFPLSDPDLVVGKSRGRRKVFIKRLLSSQRTSSMSQARIKKSGNQIRIDNLGEDKKVLV